MAIGSPDEVAGLEGENSAAALLGQVIDIVIALASPPRASLRQR